MRTPLFVNDSFCSNLEELRQYFKTNIESDSLLYEELLTIYLDGTLLHWLNEGTTEDERIILEELNKIPEGLSNSTLMEKMINIFTGNKVTIKITNINEYLKLTSFSLMYANQSINLSSEGFYPIDYDCIMNARIRIDFEVKKTKNEVIPIAVDNNTTNSSSNNEINLLNFSKGEVFSLDVPLPNVDRGLQQFKIVSDSYELGSFGLKVSLNKIINVKGINFEMIYVNGGDFVMGASSEQAADSSENEKPAHKVTVSSFFIGKYVVTQELWKAIMENDLSSCQYRSKPKVNVNWYDCQKFIGKLNEISGLSFRLPTEAEWEYAARGGEYTHNYKYSGSNIINDVAWYQHEEEIDDIGDYMEKQLDNMYKTANDVGKKAPNELGIYDMSGNVYEWCQDWYGFYNSSHQNNPLGPINGKHKIVRGGCWEVNSKGCRVSHRNGAVPDGKIKQIGFRLVLENETK